MDCRAYNISVILPACLATGALHNWVWELQKKWERIDEKYEIILVCGDGQWSEATVLCETDPHIKAMRLAGEPSKDEAISAGLRYALGSRIEVLGQPPEEVVFDREMLVKYYIGAKSTAIEETKNIALEGYGVRLIPLSGDKIEMTRGWRNEPKITCCMEYREHITAEMQRKWFESISNPNNYYFIIEYQGKQIGLINAKDIDYAARQSEAGIFLYDDSCLNSDVSFRAALCMNDFTTHTLGMLSGRAHILKSNKRAIKFNKMLGFALQSGQEELDKQLYIVTKEDILRQREYILRLIS